MRLAWLTIAFLSVAACDATTGPASGTVQDDPAPAAASADRPAPTPVREDVYDGEVGDDAPKGGITFDLRAGQVYTISTSSETGLDTVLALIGPDGRQLAENDDRGPGDLLSRLVIMAPVDGTYTAAVSGYGGASGSYRVHVREGFDSGLSESATTLEDRIVTLSGDTADVSVEIPAGEIFVATTMALSDELDTTLSLSDSTGRVVAQNDDRGDGSLNSQLVFQPVETGSFTVRVGSFSGDQSGDVVLSLALDPYAQAPFDFSSIEGAEIARYTDALDDGTTFRTVTVDLARGQTLFAMSDTVEGDLDTVLRLDNPDGHPVALNDDRGDGSLNSAIAYTAPEAGTYTVRIDRYRDGASSGRYELVLMDVDASVVDTLNEVRERIVHLSGAVETIQTEDFIVSYTLSGEDATTHAYAVTVGDALQHALDEQLNRMGWAEPVRDSDGLYRAFIVDAGGSMGVTYPVESMFDNPQTSDVRENLASRAVFVIENDFAGFDKPAPVDSLMRATATHEFAHVVQYGYDGEEGLDWLYESTASWIETATVGHHQDATDYTETDFETPGLCWTTTEDGYDYSQWTLLQSMADVHGEEIVRRIWENAVEHDGFETLEVTLAEVGTTIPDTIQRWRAQNYALDYDLAEHFPRTVALAHWLEGPGVWTQKSGPQELAANYIALDMDGRFAISLTSDADLELFALGQRNGRIEVLPLGRSGEIDTGAFDHLGLMVFNRAMPPAPGQCSSSLYSLEVAPARGSMPAAAYAFDDSHFIIPMEDADDAMLAEGE